MIIQKRGRGTGTVCFCGVFPDTCSIVWCFPASHKSSAVASCRRLWSRATSHGGAEFCQFPGGQTNPSTSSILWIDINYPAPVGSDEVTGV